MTYTIRQAVLGDLGSIRDLRRESSAWLARRGIDQWTWDVNELLRDRIERGDTWVLDNQTGQTIATITLMGPDMDFWTLDDDPDNASYVYKLMVRRNHAGEGIGSQLLDWAGDRAARQGQLWLRLDCDRSNTLLHSYYLDRGFTHVRTVYREHRQSGALFQRPARTLARPMFREPNGQLTGKA